MDLLMILNNELIKEGKTVFTKWGWWCNIKSIDESKFKHGEGINIKRLYDDATFSIHPRDII